MMTPNVLPSVIDGRYELGDVLGTGGSGAVYSARDLQTGSDVALKLLHQPLEALQVRERFERELAAYRRMEAEPGVITVHDHGVADARGWLVMDRYDLTLAQRIASEGALPVAEAVDIATKCGHALAALHAQGIVHRDIKPSNVLLSNDGRVVLGDLGVVTLSGEPTLTGMTPLSLQWVAPETIESGESSPRSDLYSFGATLFTMLHGHPPFNLSADSTGNSDATIAIGPALRMITAGPRPQLDERIPVGLRSLVDELMRAEPGDRPSDAATVVSRLRSAQSQPHTAASTNSRPRRWRIAALAAIGGVVAAAIALVLFTRPSTTETDVVADASASQVALAESVTATDAPPTPSAVATTAAPPAPTVPAAAPTPALASESASSCGGNVVWCEPLSLDDFDLVGDPSLASFEEVATPYGPGFQITPGSGEVSSGAYSAERSLLNVGDSDVIALRFRMLVDDLPAAESSEWFQQIVTLGDERQRFWSVNLTDHPSDGARLNTGYFAPPDLSGGASAEDGFATGEWQCIELVLDQGSSSPSIELLADELSVVALDDDAARDRGVGFMLRLGPNWIEDTEHAPQITLADVVVGNQALGCR